MQQRNIRKKSFFGGQTQLIIIKFIHNFLEDETVFALLLSGSSADRHPNMLTD